ncbi:MAG: double-transrane region domain protein, partial [Planctomycetaceae bacterium]|nr:double-transrane region domain protein [Planctomycetaceae bacterium]
MSKVLTFCETSRRRSRSFVIGSLGFGHSFVIRISSFVINIPTALIYNHVVHSFHLQPDLVMYFANPWGLLGLFALPVIAFIHLYQRRYPPLYVGGLFLWASETQVRMPGRRRDRLPVTNTLIIELIAALILSIVLADPRFGEWDRATHLVAILDHSASMQGQADGEPSFRDSAIRELEERFTELPRQSAVTLI